MKLKAIDIGIQGTSPLLCNRFTGAAESGVNKKRTPKEEAQESLYFDEEGRLGIPGPNVFRSLIDSGKYFKIGRRSMTTAASSMVPGAVLFDTLFCELDSEGGFVIDSRPVRIPSTGGRVLKHRAKFEDWALSFRVELDTEIITLATFRDLVDSAGQRIGLGDFRPDRKGIFGRFRVSEWTVAK